MIASRRLVVLLLVVALVTPTPPRAEAAATWTELHSPTLQHILGISCPSDLTCYVAAGLAGILKTGDGGASWQVVGPHPTAETAPTVVSCVSDSICYANFGDRQIGKTFNGGADWTAAGSPWFSNRVKSLSCKSATICYVVASGGATGVTFDGGSNWLQFRSPTLDAAEVLQLSCTDTETCYGADASGDVLQFVFERDDQWSRSHTGVPASRGLRSISCVSFNQCVAAGLNSDIVRTTDGGTTWTTHRSPSSFMSVSCVAQTCVLAGFDGEFYVSGNGGDTWSISVRHATRNLLDVTCPSAITCYAGGEYGLLMKMTGAPTVSRFNVFDTVHLPLVSLR